MTATADAVTAERAELAEGLRWDGVRDELLWVDLNVGHVRQSAVHHGLLDSHWFVDAGMPVGAVAPRRADGWVVAAGTGFFLLDEHGGLSPLAVAEPGREQTHRMNDGACDAAGRFLAGSMAYEQTIGAGSLFQLAPGGQVLTLHRGATVSNGIGWSPDGTRMYWSDSNPGVLWSFDYDPATGAMSARKVLVDFGGMAGVPDGITVDAAGEIWVAMWGSGEVLRYTPQGRLVARVPLPVSQATSPCLGGAGGTTLFIGTARDGLDEAALAREPDAGRIFAVEVETPGPPVAPYAG